MHDTNPIAILLAGQAALILTAYLLRATDRLALAHRLRRSLRLAVGRELEGGPDQDIVQGRASRPRTGPGGEDMAA